MKLNEKDIFEILDKLNGWEVYKDSEEIFTPCPENVFKGVGYFRANTAFYNLFLCMACDQFEISINFYNRGWSYDYVDQGHVMPEDDLFFNNPMLAREYAIKARLEDQRII